ncbi:hypothetical protein TRVA0_027S00650 [Trichomonascus vanleenenianus]|uniref:coiled-coil domain-containing protein MAD1 n=1 Tax=Trichomonascus vanleenenianus TaxID=2268995 RepID=UPI003EC95FE3
MESSSPFIDHPEEVNRAELNQGTPTRSKKPIFSQDLALLNEKINALTYELQTERNDREREKVWYENSIRELEQKVKDEGRRADSLETDRMFLYKQQGETSEQLESTKEQLEQEKIELEATVKKLSAGLDEVKNEYDEFTYSSREENSRLQKALSEVESQRDTLTSALESINEELQSLLNDLSAKQRTIVDQEEKITELQSKIMNNATSEEDKESFEVVQRELADQVKYTHKLEDEISFLESNLKALRDKQKVIDVVEEEKASLQSKLQSMDQLRQQLAGYELKVMELQQEKERWALYLEKDDKFSTPEDVVRALMHERVEKVNLLDRLGLLEAEYSAAKGGSQGIQQDVSRIKQELEEVRVQLDKEAKCRARLQRQKDLSARETGFLREQLKSFDSEETAFMEGNYDASKAGRIKELEQLLDSTKKEVETLHKELAERDGLVATLNSPKRKARESIMDTSSEERLTEALRRNRNLQNEHNQLQIEVAELKRVVEVQKQQISSFEKSSNTQTQRVLELKNNPTAKHEAVKAKMLAALKTENEALLQQVEQLQSSGKADESRLVPITSLDRLREEIIELEHSVQEQKKSKQRLSHVYQKLATDLRQTVYNLLGYQVDPLPNKKVKVKSVFSTSDDDVLTFIPDPAQKMRYIGIDESPLAQEFENLIAFWVRERKDIPCFLAALNLELYERSHKD